MACFRCGRYGHFASECYAKTNVKGKYLTSDSDDEESGSEYEAEIFFQQTKKRRQNEALSVPQTIGAGVYVLRTTEGMYYVGKSNNVATRIQEHRRGEGASCMQGLAFSVIPRLLTNGSTEDLESWERNETLQRMKTHGIDNVRGWMFTRARLSEEEKKNAFAQICERFDLCRRCGRNTHFAERCFAKSLDTWAGGGSIFS